MTSATEKSPKEFIEIDPVSIKDNTFKLIGTDYMLITGGTMASFNTMTASWGGFGVLWNKKIVICFVRPQRYTFRYLEESESFTLSFFHEKYRSILDFCGTASGRNVNKAAECNLTPVESSLKGVYFEQARLVLECRKIYFQDLLEQNFLDPSIKRNYPKKDFHRMYIGEIVRCIIEKF